MTTQEAFEKFMQDTVNLNKARVDRIKDAKRILTNFIKDHEDFRDLYVDTVPQGSSRQKTIIKPVGVDGKFDVDLLIKLKEKTDWTPADYLAKLAAAFKDSGVYEDITETYGKTRCVTINYEGEFHVDLVPAVEREGAIYICNKQTDEFEETDGDGYALWFEGRDLDAGGKLVPTVRLLKYLRDSKGEFDTKSIILTTIAAMQVRSDDVFSSVQEAFSVIVGRMSDHLAGFECAPSIENPAMPGENFDRHWKNDQKGFDDLKATLLAYAQAASEASRESDGEKSLKKWAALFGDAFPVNVPAMNASTPVLPIIPTAKPFTPSRPYAASE